MKKWIVLSCMLLTSIFLAAQNECPECEKFKIVGVYDFGPPPGGNFIILLLTISEDLESHFDPHYSSLFFKNSIGDTITIPLGFSYTLPQKASDTIPYLMELNTELSNQNFPVDFDGELHISTPTSGPCPHTTWCTIHYTKSILSSATLRHVSKASIIYPNPTKNSIRIESEDKIDDIRIFDQSGVLLKSYYSFKSGDIIDLNHVTAGLLMVQIKFVNNTMQSQLVLKM